MSFNSYTPLFAPIAYKSKVTGKEYPYKEYSNHGWGREKYGFKDLPSNEYPYLIIYKYKD